MNSPETDPFYDALRNRLHDYEEPLPAGGWAGIAPQLPPARPLPWWQRRPLRRRLSVLLLLLLLLPTTFLLWHHSRQPNSDSTPAALATRPAPTGMRPAAADAAATAAPAAAAPAASQPAGAGAGVRPAAARAGLPDGELAAQRPQQSASAPATRRLRRVVAPLPTSDTATTTNDLPASPSAATVAAARRKRRPSPLLLAAARAKRPLPRPGAVTSSPEAAGSSVTAPAARPVPTPAALPAEPAPTASPTVEAPAPAAATASTPPTPASSPALVPELATSHPDAAPHESTAALAPAAAAELAPATPSELAGWMAALLLPAASPLPTPLPLTSPADSLRPLRTGRLSLGFLLGLAPTRRGAGSVPEALRRQEQPGLGASGEVAARYQVGRALALRAGAGYAQQRQQVAFTLEKRQKYWISTSSIIVRNNPGGPDTMQVLSYRQRDTVLSRQHQQYQLAQHYLTLPLAAEWRPRTPFRWQPVLGLGATGTWLLSGSYLSTGDGCNCQTQTQRGAAGPFRTLSLALNAGLGLDYALGLHSTLLLRSTASYWPTATRGSSRPVALGLQVGVLFETRRRP